VSISGGKRNDRQRLRSPKAFRILWRTRVVRSDADRRAGLVARSNSAAFYAGRCRPKPGRCGAVAIHIRRRQKDTAVARVACAKLPLHSSPATFLCDVRMARVCKVDDKVDFSVCPQARWARCFRRTSDGLEHLKMPLQGVASMRTPRCMYHARTARQTTVKESGTSGVRSR